MYTEKNIDMEVKNSQEYKTAFNSSLRYLTYRARTKQEIIDYLVKKEYSNKIIYPVLDKLMEINYINDEKFVKNYIYNVINGKSKGKIRTRIELLDKGIPEKIIDKYIDLYSNDKEIAIARLISSKFFYNNTHIPIQQIKNKLYNRLMGRGFSKNAIDNAFSFLDNNLEIQTIISKQTENYEKQAYELAEKYYVRYSKKDDNILKIKQKIYAQLIRRGYSYDIYSSIIDQIIKY